MCSIGSETPGDAYLTSAPKSASVTHFLAFERPVPDLAITVQLLGTVKW